MKTAICLDDAQIRHEQFRALYEKEYTITHAYNFTQFFHFISKYPGVIDFVSLDHDLGDSTIYSIPTAPSLYGTGMMAVELLALIPAEMRPLKVNVHSHNYVRGDDMVARLKSVGYDATREFFTED